MTFAELREQVDRCALGLLVLGVQHGDAVTVQLPNWNEFAVVALALERISLSWTKLLASGAKHLAFRPTLDWLRPGPDDITSLGFTSGTTGQPKGVLHTANTLAAIVAGAAVHVAPRFDRHTFWTDVAAARASVLPFVGAMLVLLAKNPQTAHDAANPLRVGYGVPIPADLHRLFEKRFGMRLIHCYGSTEATIVAWGNDQDAVPGAVGHAFPGYEVRIHDDEDVPLPRGTVGQICVRPSEPYGMFSGYYADPEKTALSLRNAWFHTGDRGWFDEGDRLWFSDRIGDAIRCKGENISAHEVEEAFLPHPRISMVAAYGIPSELGDEEVVIAVVPQPDTSIDPVELLEWAADRLGRYAMPRYVDIVDALPMTPTGKVEKYKLRARGRSPSAYDARAGLRTGSL
jgi:crotonobetaine/carnitine-CoA ligase